MLEKLLKLTPKLVLKNQFHMNKSNKEVPLTTQETFLLYIKPPIFKTGKSVFRK